MPCVLDHLGRLVFTGLSDAECVRWWNVAGRAGDRLGDTGELMSTVADILQLEED